MCRIIKYISIFVLSLFTIAYILVMNQRRALFTKTSIQQKKKQYVTIPQSIRIPEINATKTCSCGGWSSWHSHNKSTPDCCIRQSTQILWAFADLFEGHDIKYTLKGGTALGAIRCCSFLSYDYDLDLFVYTTENYLKEIMDEWVEEQLKTNGILSQIGVTVGGLPWIGNGWGKFEQSNFEKGDVHVDFRFGLKQNISVVPCMFGGRIVQCDDDSRSKLKETYGDDWFVPHRWQNWDKGILCEEIDLIQKQKCDQARNDVMQMYRTKYPNLLIGLTDCKKQ